MGLLVFVFAVGVVAGVFDFVGEILLLYPMIIKCVGIEIMLSLNRRILAVVMLVLKLTGNGSDISLFYVLKG